MLDERATDRAFVREYTTPCEVAFLPGIRLHQAAQVDQIWRAAAARAGNLDAPIPFWAFAWSGGLAVARCVLDLPELVCGKRVLDVGAGSGVVAIAAARAGALSVTAADSDPMAQVAILLNAVINCCTVGIMAADLLASEPPPVDVVLAGDVCYERRLAARMLGWLRRAAQRGSDVLVGDPGRPFFQRAGMRLVRAYDIPASRDLEGTDVMVTKVYRVVG